MSWNNYTKIIRDIISTNNIIDRNIDFPVRRTQILNNYELFPSARGIVKTKGYHHLYKHRGVSW